MLSAVGGDQRQRGDPVRKAIVLDRSKLLGFRICSEPARGEGRIAVPMIGKVSGSRKRGTLPTGNSRPNR
jgi:hypothetical protein